MHSGPVALRPNTHTGLLHETLDHWPSAQTRNSRNATGFRVMGESQFSLLGRAASVYSTVAWHLKTRRGSLKAEAASSVPTEQPAHCSLHHGTTRFHCSIGHLRGHYIAWSSSPRTRQEAAPTCLLCLGGHLAVLKLKQALHATLVSAIINQQLQIPLLCLF